VCDAWGSVCSWVAAATGFADWKSQHARGRDRIASWWLVSFVCGVDRPYPARDASATQAVTGYYSQPSAENSQFAENKWHKLAKGARRVQQIHFLRAEGFYHCCRTIASIWRGVAGRKQGSRRRSRCMVQQGCPQHPACLPLRLFQYLRGSLRLSNQQTLLRPRRAKCITDGEKGKRANQDRKGRNS
jgi:hypothetical protein